MEPGDGARHTDLFSPPPLLQGLASCFLNDGVCFGDMGKEDSASRYFPPASLLVFILTDINKLIYCLPSGSNQVSADFFYFFFSTWDSPPTPHVIQDAGWEQNSWHFQ